MASGVSDPESNGDGYTKSMVLAGDLRLSNEQQRRWGFSPDTELLLEETPAGLLLRRADAPLAKVYVEPTSACNLTCRTCMRNTWDEPTGTMALATYHALIDGLRAVPTLRTVAFWGIGEPLLHPNIVEMVVLAKGLGAQTELITNAHLLDAKRAEGLIKARLDRLIVSIDGFTVEGYANVRSGGDLSIVEGNVAGLRAIRDSKGSNKPEIGIEFVLTRSNVGELAHLRSGAARMGASFVVVSHLLPYCREMQDEILYGSRVLWPYPIGRSRVRWHYPIGRSQYNPEILLPILDMRREVQEPLFALLRQVGGYLPPGYVAGVYCRFVNEGALAVAWDGGASPCVALLHSYRCYILGREKHIRRYVVGNVGTEAIRDIWAREEFVRFRSRVTVFDFPECTDCGCCYAVESNEEDCFGNPFPVCGDCLWARGVIQCP